MKPKELKNSLVVKSNNLVSAVYSLSLTESRIVQMAMVAGREQNSEVCLDDQTPVKLYAKDYAETFDTKTETAFEAMKNAQDSLFRREFTILDEKGNKARWHWVQSVKPIEGEAAIEVLFTKGVCEGITRLMKDFTQYRLAETAGLQSSYGLRLYELLSSWLRVGAVYMELEDFRGWMGLGDKYKLMHQFKARVLDHAVKDINDNSPMNVSYTQRKAGRRIIGFDFSFSNSQPATKPKAENPANSPADPKRVDPVYNNIALSKIVEYASQISQLPDQMANWGTYGGQGKMQTIITAELTTPEGYQKWLPELKQLGHQELI